MKDAINNIEIIKSVLYSDFFRPDDVVNIPEKEQFRVLEERYPFITLVDSFASGGLSTLLQNAFLNHLIKSFEKVNYMEVGLYHGSSLSSALAHNEDNLNKIVVNDSWNWGDAQYNIFENNLIKVLELYYEEEYNLSCVKNKIPLSYKEKVDSESERIIKLDNTFNMTIVKGDTWRSANTIIKQWAENKVDIYFYDGNHSFESQRDALIYFQDCFADEFIYLVDDWGDEDVVKGTYAGIEKIGYEILFSDNTSNWGADPTSRYGWGSGWFIAYLKKE